MRLVNDFFSRSIGSGLLLVVCALLLQACSSSQWFGDEEDAPLEGERISVIEYESGVTVASSLQDEPVVLEEPYENQAWLQDGGFPAHNPGHLAFDTNYEVMWSNDIGSSNSSDQYALSQPIVVLNAIFAMDAEATVSAFRASDGREVWSVNLTPEEEDDTIVSGGVAYGNRRVYAATGYGEVVAFNPGNGKILWRVSVGAPVRAAPTVKDARLFILTFDNQLHALDTRTGETLWSYEGLNELTSVLGGASPAAFEDAVIAPFSNGEIAAFKPDSGRLLWVDSLDVGARYVRDRLSNIADIQANPVIDDGRLYAINHGGRLGVFDAESGQRIWAREIGGVQTPVISGDHLFVLDNNQKVYCLNKRDGRARWITQLPAFEDEEDKEDPILWQGPVLAGEDLIFAGTDGSVLAVSPFDGELERRLDLSGAFYVAPLLANKMLYLLDNSAELHVLK